MSHRTPDDYYTDYLLERCTWILTFACLDCDHITLDEYYMVNWSIWNTAMDRPPIDKQICYRFDGMLCIGCLENRIGRKLNKKDFLDAPINKIVVHQPKTKRLLNRLNRNT